MSRRLLTPDQEKHLSLSDEMQRNWKELMQKVRLQPSENGHGASDHRLLAIANTQFELGFMALNKAITNPENGVSTERVVQNQTVVER